MEITQECYELFGTNPGSKTPRNSSCMATDSSFKKTTTKKPCKTLLENEGRSSVDPYTWTCQYWPTSKNCSVSTQGVVWKNWWGVMDDRNGWKERMKEIRVVSVI